MRPGQGTQTWAAYTPRLPAQITHTYTRTPTVTGHRVCGWVHELTAFKPQGDV